MKYRIRLAAALAASGLAAVASPARAVPYASGLRNTAGNTWEFVLNEGADNVTVLRNGGNAVNLGGLAAGRHTFDMTGFTSFDIEVSKDAPKAWTELSDGTNLFTRFEQPAGLAVNKNPASPYFGTVYVSNSRNLPTAIAGEATIPAREMGEGIYSLTGDLQGVNLSTSNWAVPDAQDTSQAKAPNWVMDTTSNSAIPLENTNGARSPWRIGLDDAGNLIATDWSAVSGGMKWATPNLTNGGQLLYKTNESSTQGVTNDLGEYIHSTISSKPNISGTLGVDLTVTAADSLMRTTPDAAASARSNVWKWNLGSFNPATQGEFQGTPELLIQGNKLGGDKNWYVSVASVANDVHYSPEHDLYYMTQPRSDGLQSSLIIVKAGGVNGDAPEVLFSSLDYSVANNLDGFVDVTGGTRPEIQDVFRNAGTVELSEDGTKLFLRRKQVNGTAAGTGANENPVLGRSSNNPEAVLVIPLDAQGLPVLTIDNKGTPEFTDDQFTKLDGFQIAGFTSGPTDHEIEFDAAGNVYTTSSSAEVLQVFSPGGNTKAVTSSNGSFVVTEIGAGLAGDFNSDSVVDGADFLVWQRGGSPNPLSSGDLDLWKANFGQSAAAPAVGSVPEPSTGVLALAATFGASIMASRRRS